MLTGDDLRKVEIWLDVCKEEMESLTDWEKEFVESIDDQLTMTGSLSFKQQDTLKKIYDKVV